MSSSFDTEVLRRLPLAEATLSLYRWALDDAFLASLWDDHRGRNYEREISFSLMVSLIFASLVKHGSGRKAFARAIDEKQLKATPAAAYSKLSCLPMKLSEAFLAKTSDRLLEVCPPPALSPTADFPSLEGLRPMILDGKTTKHVPRRLMPLRNSKQTVLGAKSLVAMDQRTQMIVAMANDPDGETNESILIPAVVQQLRPRFAEPILFVCDRQFYALSHYQEFTARAGDHFLVRHHSGLGFTADSEVPERTGTDRYGRAYVEQWGWVGGVKHPKRRYVRRIVVRRDSEDLAVLTSLLDADRYLADDLLEMYFRRWGIEMIFQKVTEVFDLKRLIGTTVEATTFQLAFCLLLYNMILVTGIYVAQGSKPKEAKKAEGLTLQTLSLEMLFTDIREQLISVATLLAWTAVPHLLTPMQTAARVREKLEMLLGPLWRPIWRKSPRQRGRPKPVPNKLRSSKHRSAHRLTAEYETKKSKKAKTG
jgi:hypothetical protein